MRLDTHAFRSWCPHFVAGRGRASPHVAAPAGELLAYLGPKGAQVTLLVVKDKKTGCLGATQVPSQGVEPYSQAFLVGWLRGLGYKRLVMRSDNERALLALLRSVAANLEGAEVVEQSCPEGDHAANGLAEVAVREAKAQVRVLKSHLEERLGRRLEWTEPLASWIVRHAANCLSRYRVQADGRTPDQRRTGKKWRRLASLARESPSTQWLREGERRAAGDAERMLDGIFVGHHERTGAALFLTSKGVLRGMRIQRRAEGQWDSAFIASCRGKPWNMKGEEASRKEAVHSQAGCGTLRCN